MSQIKLISVSQQNDIIVTIRQSYRNLKNLINQIEIATSVSVNNAQLTYDLNLEKYKNGDSDRNGSEYLSEPAFSEQA